MEELRTKVLPSAPFSPSDPMLIFKALEQDLDDIKVVIIGQDPYPDPKMATGLAFAIPPTAKPTYSLKKIADELLTSVTHDFYQETPDLNLWAKEGVLLLNKSLTCEVGKPGSHRRYWSNFTDEVIRTVASTGDRIWLLWGRDAIDSQGLIESIGKQTIFTANHPAAERYGHKFVGCKHFKLTNDTLIEQGKEPVEWCPKVK